MLQLQLVMRPQGGEAETVFPLVNSSSAAQRALDEAGREAAAARGAERVAAAAREAERVAAAAREAERVADAAREAAELRTRAAIIPLLGIGAVGRRLYHSPCPTVIHVVSRRLVRPDHRLSWADAPLSQRATARQCSINNRAAAIISGSAGLSLCLAATAIHARVWGIQSNYALMVAINGLNQSGCPHDTFCFASYWYSRYKGSIVSVPKGRCMQHLMRGTQMACRQQTIDLIY